MLTYCARALPVLLIAACSAVGPRSAEPKPAAGPGAPSGLKIGTLVGRGAMVTILATPDGTRYDVRTTDGVLIAEDVSAGEVADRTGQDPRGAWALIAPWESEAPAPLMMADERFGPPGRD